MRHPKNGDNMKYKGIIFDLDGTLLNTLLDLADSVNFALEQYGLPAHETDAYRKMVGGGFANLIENAIAASIRKMQASAAAEALLARQKEAGNVNASESVAIEENPVITEGKPVIAREKPVITEEKPVITEVADAVDAPQEEAAALETLVAPREDKQGEMNPENNLPAAEEDILPSGRMTEEEKAALHRGVFDAFTEEYSRRYQRSTAPYPGIQAMLSHLADAGVKIAVNSNKRDDYTKNLISRNFPDLEWVEVLGGKADMPKKPDPAGAIEIAEKMGIKPKMVKVQENDAADNISGISRAGAMPNPFEPGNAAANPFEAEEEKKGFFARLFSLGKKEDNENVRGGFDPAARGSDRGKDGSDRGRDGKNVEKKLLYTEMAYVGDSNVDIRTAKNAGMTAVGVAWGFRGRQELQESGADFIAEDPLQLEEFLLSER